MAANKECPVRSGLIVRLIATVSGWELLPLSCDILHKTIFSSWSGLWSLHARLGSFRDECNWCSNDSDDWISWDIGVSELLLDCFLIHCSVRCFSRFSLSSFFRCWNFNLFRHAWNGICMHYNGQMDTKGLDHRIMVHRKRGINSGHNSCTRL